MTNNNNYEKKNFRALIESDGIGRVDDRLNIIDAFLDTEDHVTLEEFIFTLDQELNRGRLIQDIMLMQERLQQKL